MRKIDLNHWFIGDNSLSISLFNFWVDINIKSSKNKVYTQLEIIDGNMERVVFDFTTLEEAVNFTENVISKYKSIQKIAIIYKDKYSRNNKMVNDKDIKMVLTPDEVKQAIIEYYNYNNNYNVSVMEKLNMNKDKINVTYFLIKYLSYDDIKKEKKIRLDDGDLKKVLNNYIKVYNYELVDYEYIGDIYESGNSIKKDNIYYNGIELNVRERGRLLVLD